MTIELIPVISFSISNNCVKREVSGYRDGIQNTQPSMVMYLQSNGMDATY